MSKKSAQPECKCDCHTYIDDNNEFAHNLEHCLDCQPVNPGSKPDRVGFDGQKCEEVGCKIEHKSPPVDRTEDCQDAAQPECYDNRAAHVIGRGENKCRVCKKIFKQSPDANEQWIGLPVAHRVTLQKTQPSKKEQDWEKEFRDRFSSHCEGYELDTLLNLKTEELLVFIRHLLAQNREEERVRAIEECVELLRYKAGKAPTQIVYSSALETAADILESLISPDKPKSDGN